MSLAWGLQVSRKTCVSEFLDHHKTEKQPHWARPQWWGEAGEEGLAFFPPRLSGIACACGGSVNTWEPMKSAQEVRMPLVSGAFPGNQLCGFS